MNSEAELFEAYYRQELSPAEAADFEQTLKTRKEVADRYRDFTYMAAGIQYYNRRQLLDRLKEEGEKDEAPLPAKVIPLYRRKGLLTAAAALLIGLTAAVYFILVNVSKDPLYFAYDKPFTQLEISRPRGEGNLYGLKMAAKEAYEEGAYRQSLQLVEDLIREAGPDGELYFIQGLNQLALGSLAAAEENFTRALGFRFRHVQDAKWYLVLTYLKQDKEQEAVNLLEDLAGSDGKYQQASQELLHQLQQP